MTDPHRPDDPVSPWQRSGATDPSMIAYPQQSDPVYAGQLPAYPAGYPPQPPTPVPAQPWTTGQPPTPPPGDGSGSGGEGGEGPGKPPRFPTWLWLLSGAAVLLVVGLVIALAIVNGSTERSATVTPIPPRPSASNTTTAPTRPPTTTTAPPSTGPSTTTTTPPTTSTTSPGVPETVVYSVTGEGRALSIAYISTGGGLQTEFNVALPWTKQVTLTPPTSKIASVTVVNVGAQVGCSVTVDGAQLSQRTGAIFVVCTAAG